MNKSGLVAAVAAQVGSDQAQARRHIDAVFQTIMSSVMDGERVVVTGFGTFDRVTRPARTVRNPRTGRPIQVAASQAPRFSVGRTFKEHVSGAAPAASSTTAAAGAPAPAQVSAMVPAERAAEVAADTASDTKKKKKRKDVAASTNGGKKAKPAKSAKPSKPAKPGKKAARKGK